MSETYAVDLQYNPDVIGLTGYFNESLTASLFKYLTHKGIKVYKAEAPVVMYEGETITMMTRKALIDCPMMETFEQIYEHLVEHNIDEIFLFAFHQQYIFAAPVDGAYVPTGEPVLREYRNIRYGVRGND